MKKLWDNLRKRHVIHVGAIYLIVAWLVVQVTVISVDPLGLPDWFDTAVMFLVAIGFPIALVLAWAFEVTPDGVKKSSEVFDSGGGAPQSGGKATLAVMPFADLSDDKAHESLADGMTEDIITGLSFYSNLAVVSRNAVFVYKDKPTDLRQVGRDLNVRYVLEGSVRPIGARIRVTAQLIETATGSHLWAEKYDRPLGEIFDLQDDVMEEILGAVGGKIGAAEQERAKSQKFERLSGWNATGKALYVMGSATGDRDKMLEAREMLKSLLEKEPDSGMAHAALVFINAIIIVNGETDDLTTHFAEAQEHIGPALKFGSTDHNVLDFIGASHLYFGQWEDAARFLKKALELNPHDGFAMCKLGLSYAYLGKYDEGRVLRARAHRIAPNLPISLQYAWYEGLADFAEGRYEDAEENIRDLLLDARDYSAPHMVLALVQEMQGKHPQAIKSIHRGRKIGPEKTLEISQLLPISHLDPEESDRRKEIFESLWEEADKTLLEA